VTPAQRARRIAGIEADLTSLRIHVKHPRGRLALSKAEAAMVELRLSLTEQLADDMLESARGTYGRAYR
jgi:hypothetical protein